MNFAMRSPMRSPVRLASTSAHASAHTSARGTATVTAKARAVTHPLVARLATVPALLAVLAFWATAAPGETLPAPEGDVILTVTGQIAVSNATAEDGEPKAQFDLAMLEALPATEFTTGTIWTDGAQRYTGVELGSFLEALGAEGRQIEATAINDYSVEIPVSDARAGGPILAYRVDGAAMSRRDKGPIWLIYPYDQNVDYRSETVYSRSIWQLDRLHIE